MTQAENTVEGLDRDAVDPDLLELPAPPQSRRFVVLVLMALVVAASLALSLSLRHDIAFFFAPSETIDLGDVREIEPAHLRTNTHVRVTGTPMTSRAVRYRRILSGGEYVVFPLAGQRTVYVHADDDPEAIARSEFTGRLVTFDELGGRIGTVESYLRSEMDLPVSGQSFLILADETPGSYAWALLLALLCGLFILADVALFFRWFRPRSKAPDEEPDEEVV